MDYALPWLLPVCSKVLVFAQRGGNDRAWVLRRWCCQRIIWLSPCEEARYGESVVVSRQPWRASGVADSRRRAMPGAGLRTADARVTRVRA